MHIAGLGPLAVMPAFQRQGVGSALVRAGTHRLRSAGYDAIVLLGHLSYYPRHGFALAASLNLRPGDDGVTPSHFQALLLRGQAPTKPLHLRYAPQFFDLE